jgi:hypothetical protein
MFVSDRQYLLAIHQGNTVIETSEIFPRIADGGVRAKEIAGIERTWRIIAVRNDFGRQTIQNYAFKSIWRPRSHINIGFDRRERSDVVPRLVLDRPEGSHELSHFCARNNISFRNILCS